MTYVKNRGQGSSKRAKRHEIHGNIFSIVVLFGISVCDI